LFIITIFFWCISKEYSYKLGLAYRLSGIVNIPLKETFRIPRPFGEEGIRYLRQETATGYSFPSGHTQSTAAYATSLMTEYKKKWLTAGGLSLIGLVALSRIYVGAHRPSEVIVGAFLGLGWILFFNRYYHLLRRINKLYVLAILAVITMAGMVILQDPDWYKTSGVILSLVAGCLIEAKYIGFEVKGPLPRQMAKVVFGLAIALVIKSGLKVIFPPVMLWDFIRYFCLGLWVTTGAPAVFKMVFKEKDAATMEA